MKQCKVYISGPYTHGDTASHVRNAIDLWGDLLDLGFVALCPHTSFLQQMIHPIPHETWMAYDKALVDMCQAVIRLPGYSPGGDEEVAYAENKGIPVFHSKEDFLSWWKKSMGS